jgi:signal transduction histidine kinase
MDERTASITVRDSGPGIPTSMRNAIFEPFVQLGRTLTSAHEGTGLGLAISRDLARAMGGDVSIAEPDGGGAAFTLTLPVV